MKIVTSAASIGTAAALAGNAVLKTEAKRFLALACVQIDAEENAVTLKLNNLSFEVSTTVGAQVAEPGKTAIDAEKFDTLVGTLRGADVSIETQDTVALIKSGGRRFKLATVPTGECPVDLKLDGEIGQAQVERIAAYGLFAEIEAALADSKEPRSYLHGGFLHHPKTGTLCCTATDGKIAVMQTAAADGVLTQDRTLVVPTAAIARIKAILGNKSITGDSAILRRSKALFALELGGTHFVTRLLDCGGFPQVEAIIAAPAEGVTVARGALRQALIRADTVGDNRRLDLSWQDGALRLAVADISEDSIDGSVAQAGSFGVDVSRLLSVIEGLHGDSVTLASRDPEEPLQIRTENAGFLAVLAPRRN